MKKSIKTFFEKYEQQNDPIVEMANIHPKNSGLKYKVYISKEPSVEHNIPRLKVNLDGNNWYPISISEMPEWLTDNVPMIDSKTFKAIKQFVVLNHDNLVLLWNDEIDTFDFMKNMKKV